MLIPSIDILGGRAVQQRGGNFPLLEAGNPMELAEKYSRIGEIAVVDLDAALSRGNNRSLVCAIVHAFPARVGGGIRSKEDALYYLDRGARAVVIGTQAEPEFLSQLPRERVIAALDEKAGKVVVEGWRASTGRTIEERIPQLEAYVSGFLVTFADREGDLGGIDVERPARLIELARACHSSGRGANGAPARFTFAGGARTAAEVGNFDRMGADVQAGTALVLKEMTLAKALAACLVSDRPDGLWPTVICDEGGRSLGFAYSNIESLDHALETGQGAYHSRRRGLWIKGQSSGHTQKLHRVEADCDRDCLLFTVTQQGTGFCHTGTRNCWNNGSGIEALERTISARKASAPQGSYTRRLFDDPDLVRAKILEEAAELAEASDTDHVTAEASDLIYFVLTKAIASGSSLAAIEAELSRRSLKISRRPGNAKGKQT